LIEPVQDLTTVAYEADGKAVVVAHGDIDLDTVAGLRDCLAGCLARNATDITVDMRDLTFIDSTGLSVLAITTKRLGDNGGRLVVRNPPPNARKVLEITGLDSVVTIEYDTPFGVSHDH
jgi:anti-sigma B factor antagonist